MIYFSAIYHTKRKTSTMKVEEEIAEAKHHDGERRAWIEDDMFQVTVGQKHRLVTWCSTLGSQVTFRVKHVQI